MKIEKNHFCFVIHVHFKSWLRYTRRPHFSPLGNFGNLVIVERPLILFSNDFLSDLIENLKLYFKFSAKVRTDERNRAKIIRPILLFPNELKNKVKLARKFDLFLLKLQLNKFLSDCTRTVHFLTSRHQQWIIRRNKNEKYILDMNDEWSMMTYNEKLRPKIEKETREVIKLTDLTTVVTKKLQTKYQFENKVVFLPNAVDVKHYKPQFAKDTERIEEKPITELVEDIRIVHKQKNDPRLHSTDLSIFDKLKSPIVGSYSGLSGNWSDFKFIHTVEQILPKEYTMIASGNIHPPTSEKFMSEYQEYIKNPRMIYLGYVDYAKLPDFLEHLDVALVMHRADEFNTHSAPNKIWAYLAMGLPVVSTDFLTEPDKEIYEGLVKFARTPEEYVEFIIESYKNDTQELKRKRRELAVRYSTDARAGKLVNIINERLFNL